MAVSTIRSPAVTSQILRTAAAQSLAVRQTRARITPQVAANAVDLANNRPNLDPGIISGLAVAGVTPDDPVIDIVDQATMSQAITKNDSMFDFSRGLTPATAFDELLYDPLKGMFRNAFNVFNAGIEEAESAFVRAPVGLYQGNANPMAAAGRSDFFHTAVQGIQGENINLGDGFFPQSTLAPDVAEGLATGMSLADATAGSMQQQELGAPVTQMGTADRERLQITSRGGKAVPISLGRLAAITVAEPGSNEFHYISGMTDFAKQVFLDPADLMLAGAGQARKLRKMPGIMSDGANAGVIAKTLDGMLLGGSGRKTVLSRNWKEYLTNDASRGDASWVKWFTDQTGDEGTANVYDLLSHSQGRPADPDLVQQLISITDEGEMFDRLQAMGDTGKLTTKFRGGFRDLGAGTNIRGNAHGLGIRSNIRGTQLGRLVNATNSKVLNVMDPRQATQELDIYMTNMGFSDEKRAMYLNRAINERYDPADLLAGLGEADESKSAHSFYFGLLKDITDDFVKDAKKSLKGVDGEEVDQASQVLDRLGTIFDDMEGYRAYWLNAIGDDMVFGGAKFTTTVNGGAEAMPSAVTFSQFLEQSIPLIDSNKMRALNRRTGWVGDHMPEKARKSLFGMKDYNKLGNNVFMDAADWYVSKLWKPSVLLRVSWPVRVIGEEQLRMSGAMLAGTFNHPLQYLSVSFMKKNSVLKKMARLEDDVFLDQLASSDAAEAAMASTGASSTYGVGNARWKGAEKAKLSRSDAANAHVHAVNQLDTDPIAAAIAASVQGQFRKKFAFEAGMTQDEWDALTPDDIAGLAVEWDRLVHMDWENIDLSDVKEMFSANDGKLSRIRTLMLNEGGRWNFLARRAEAENYIDTVYGLIHQQGGGKGALLHYDTRRYYDFDGVGTDPLNPGAVAKADLPAGPGDPLTKGQRLASGQLDSGAGPRPRDGSLSPQGTLDDVDVQFEEISNWYGLDGTIDEAEANELLHEMVDEFANSGGVPPESAATMHASIDQNIRAPGANSTDQNMGMEVLDAEYAKIESWMTDEVARMGSDQANSLPSGDMTSSAVGRPPQSYTKQELGGEEIYLPHQQAEAWGGIQREAYQSAYADMGVESLIMNQEGKVMAKRIDGWDTMSPDAREAAWNKLTRIEKDQIHDEAARMWLNREDMPTDWDMDGDAVQVFENPASTSISGKLEKEYTHVDADGRVTAKMVFSVASEDGEMGVKAGQIIGTPLIIGDNRSVMAIYRQMRRNPDDMMDAEAFLRMTTGGETIGDYMRRIGVDIPKDASPEDIVKIINSDPDLWEDISRLAADNRMAPGNGLNTLTEQGANAQQSIVKGKTRATLADVSQSQPGLVLEEAGSTKLWELLSTGKVDGKAWGTTRADNGARLTPPQMRKLNDERIALMSSDEWFDSMPDYLRVMDKDPSSTERVGQMDKAVNFLFSFLMAKPTNYLSRSPAFKQFYWRRVAHMYHQMTPNVQDELLTKVRSEGINVLKPADEGFSWYHDLGKPLRSVREASGRMTAVDEVIATFEKGAKGKLGSGQIDSMLEIDDIAKSYALEETKRLLYDLSNRHNWSDQLRIILPFGEAWYEVISTWGRLMKENPANMRRMQQTLQGGRTSDPFSGVDVDGEQGHGMFYTDDVTGEEMFSIPGVNMVKDWMLEGGVQDNINFAGRLSAMNIAAQVIPGLGPLVQIPISQMGWADDPDYKWLQEIALPFGKSPVDIKNPTTWMSPVTPKWVNTALAAFAGDSDEDTMRVYHNTVIDVYKSLLINGWSADTPDEMVATLAEAGKQAKTIYRIKFASQFLGPTTQTAHFEVRYDEGDLDGTIWAFQNLATAYREILDNVQGDEVLAFKSFTERFGVDPMLFAVGKTERVLPKAVTLEARKWEHDNEDLYQLDSYQNTAYFSHPDPVDGEFYYDAYLLQLESDSRVSLSPEQWALKRNQFLGRIAYNNMQRVADRRYSNSNEGTNWLRQQYTLLMEKYPGYGQPITGMPQKPSLDEQVDELYMWEAEPRLGDSVVGQSLAEYLVQRDRVVRRTMQDLGYQTEISFRSGKNASRYRAQLRAFGQHLVDENPDFLPLWEQILSRELDEPESTLGPVNLAGVEF